MLAFANVRINENSVDYIMFRYSLCGSSPDLSSGLMAGAEGRLALFVAAILASGYDNGPAAGPGGRGSTGPGVLLPGSQGRFSLVRVLAEARRCAATRR